MAQGAARGDAMENSTDCTASPRPSCRTTSSRSQHAQRSRRGCARCSESRHTRHGATRGLGSARHYPSWRRGCQPHTDSLTGAEYSTSRPAEKVVEMVAVAMAAVDWGVATGEGATEEEAKAGVRVAARAAVARVAARAAVVMEAAMAGVVLEAARAEATAAGLAEAMAAARVEAMEAAGVVEEAAGLEEEEEALEAATAAASIFDHSLCSRSKSHRRRIEMCCLHRRRGCHGQNCTYLSTGIR